MNTQRIYAMILRHLYGFKYSIDRLADIFYWPLLDLALWGLTSAYFTKSLAIPNAVNFVLLVVAGNIFWFIVSRAQYEITTNLLLDIWNKNLINMFVSPLRFSEWLMSCVILAFIKAAICLLFSAGVALVLYKLHILNFFGWYLPAFAVLFLASGMWMGFFILGLIFRFGRRIEAFSWVLGPIISPFCAIYYPVSVLPGWAQSIAWTFPQTYLFEAMRQFIAHGTVNSSYLGWSLVLNAVYIVLSLVFLKLSFDKRFEYGLLTIT